MGFYNYKRVMHRDDFLAEAAVYVEELKAEGYGNEYEGTCDYDGDGWVVTERLLNKKDAEIARLTAALAAAEAAREEAQREVDLYRGSGELLVGAEERAQALESRLAEVERERDAALERARYWHAERDRLHGGFDDG